jgi:Immunity protein Imm1
VLDTRDCVKFLIDNEPTAVSRYYCLPMELVKKITTHFLETGERSNDVRWEEI